MTKFAVGSAMGFMVGAGLMMMPAGRAMRRDAKRKVGMVKKWLKTM